MITMPSLTSLVEYYIPGQLSCSNPVTSSDTTIRPRLRTLVFPTLGPSASFPAIASCFIFFERPSSRSSVTTPGRPFWLAFCHLEVPSRHTIGNKIWLNDNFRSRRSVASDILHLFSFHDASPFHVFIIHLNIYAENSADACSRINLYRTRRLSNCNANFLPTPR